MKLRSAWTFEVDGRMLNAFTIVSDGLTLCHYVPYAENAARIVSALREDGTTAWSANWPRIENYFVCRGSLYLGGSHARRVEIQTGRVLAEQEFASEVNILPPIPSGPVYSDRSRVIGLDPGNLSIAWEVPDPEEELVAHGARLCRYTPDGLMSHIDLTTLEESIPVQAPRPPSNGAALHAHVGDTWCFFYVSEGGRRAIDEKTGKVRWHDDDPAGHGLPAFDAERAYSAGGGGVSAYDLQSGRRLWRQPCGPQSRWLSSEPRIESGRIYAGTRDGLVCVIDPGSGDLLFSEQVDARPDAVLPLGETRLIVGAKNAIICYELS